MIKIVTWDHDFGSNIRFETIHEGWNSVEQAQVLYLRDKEITYEKMREIIKEEKPVFCYLSGTITSYFNFNDRILKACRVTKTPVIIAPRGDICRNALKIKIAKKILAVIFCRMRNVFKDVYFQSTLAEESYYLKRLFSVDKTRIFEIPNLPAFINPGYSKRKIAGTAEFVFISRIARKKNLSDVIKSVNKTKCNVKLDIYGPIEDEDYWKECQTFIQDAPHNVSITYRGALNVDQAKEVFKQYDAFIFETLSENYGHVIIESLLCGCPVILSKGTTPWDDIDSYAGFTADLGEIDAFASIIDRIAMMDEAVYMKLRKQAGEYAIRKINIDELIIKYKKMFQMVCEHGNN